MVHTHVIFSTIVVNGGLRLKYNICFIKPTDTDQIASLTMSVQHPTHLEDEMTSEDVSFVAEQCDSPESLIITGIWCQRQTSIQHVRLRRRFRAGSSRR